MRYGDLFRQAYRLGFSLKEARVWARERMLTMQEEFEERYGYKWTTARITAPVGGVDPELDDFEWFEDPDPIEYADTQTEMNIIMSRGHRL